MAAVRMPDDQDPEWTPVRRAILIETVRHLLPIPETASSTERTQATEAVVGYVLSTLANPSFSTQQPFVWAALDQLEAWADEGGTASSMEDSDARERLLRRLEADSNPYLVHALDLLLQLTLEGCLGDPRHGGNPGGQSWVNLGLTPLGPRHRQGSAYPATEGSER